MTTNLDEKVHKISSKLGLGSDAYNVILYELYEKMDSVGKSGKPTGEYGWRIAKNGAYFNNIERLGDNLADRAEKEAIDEVGIEFEKFKEFMNEWKDDLKTHLKEHITLELAKVKDVSKKDESK